MCIRDRNSADIFVDVGGAVRDPRVVHIGKGARVYEAVEAAGGVTADAETKYINMAAECSDGQKIYVPTKEETEAAQSGGNSDSKLFSTDASELDSGKAKEQGTAGDKVNINTATSEQLQTLNGIGPVSYTHLDVYKRQVHRRA